MNVHAFRSNHDQALFGEDRYWLTLGIEQCQSAAIGLEITVWEQTREELLLLLVIFNRHRGNFTQSLNTMQASV